MAWQQRYTVRRTRVRDRYGQPVRIGEIRYDKGHTEADANEMARRYQAISDEWRVDVIPTSEVWQVVYQYDRPKSGMPEFASMVTAFKARPRIGYRFKDAFGTATITAAKYIRDL